MEKKKKKTKKGHRGRVNRVFGEFTRATGRLSCVPISLPVSRLRNFFFFFFSLSDRSKRRMVTGVTRKGFGQREGEGREQKRQRARPYGKSERGGKPRQCRSVFLSIFRRSSQTRRQSESRASHEGGDDGALAPILVLSLYPIPEKKMNK